MLDASFSDFGNGLAFKQTYTSLHDMLKTDDILHAFLSTFSILLISFKVKVNVYLERAMVTTYI